MNYNSKKFKDNELFNLNPKTHYDIEPVGFLKPIDAPSRSLRPIEFVTNDSKKPAVDLRPKIIQDYRQIPTDYIDYVNTKINYLI
jgi:hypothetical protein